MTRPRRGSALLAALLGLLGLLALLLAGAAAAAPSFPALTGRVVDDAHVLPAAESAAITAKLADLERRTGRQLVVVTLPSLQGDDIADYGYQLGRAWGIGRKGLDNGALFIIAPTERKVRIEVGYGLEPILTDALSSQILQERVFPKFRAGDLPGGVEAGVDGLVEQLGLEPSAAEEKAAAAARARQEAAQDGAAHRPVSVLGLLIPLLFLLFVFSRLFRGGGGFLPGLVIGSMMGGFGGGEDRGGGGGDDDDFSGGGGSFGGGGASGSW